MKVTLVFAAILIFEVAQSYEGSFRCPKMWTEFNGHCYRFFNQPRFNFEKSQEYCQGFSLDPDGCPCRRANLVTIDSLEENTFIYEWWQTQRTPYNGRQQVRIGYTDSGSKGNWRWVGGNSNFTCWDSGQPDNWKRVGQDCAVMWRRAANNDIGAWDDEKCCNDRAFICEF